MPAAPCDSQAPAQSPSMSCSPEETDMWRLDRHTIENYIHTLCDSHIKLTVNS